MKPGDSKPSIPKHGVVFRECVGISRGGGGQHHQSEGGGGRRRHTVLLRDEVQRYTLAIWNQGRPDLLHQLFAGGRIKMVEEKAPRTPPQRHRRPAGSVGPPRRTWSHSRWLRPARWAS